MIDSLSDAAAQYFSAKVLAARTPLAEACDKE
jgi:hypothetical protein